MASDYFLKLDGVDGESTEQGHVGELDILSWSWGATNSGARAGGGGGGAGKVVFQDIHFTKTIDKSSPQLMLRCATGQHIPSATLTVRRESSAPPTPGTPEDVLCVITMTDCLVSSYQCSAPSSSSDPVPTDSFSLNFTKIEFEYRSSTGERVRACYDIKRSRAC